jgi:branched-chain amino acid transport system substrate-binding protein
MLAVHLLNVVAERSDSAAVGLCMNHYQKAVSNAYLISPNYAPGGDMLAGVKSTFKGKIAGEDDTSWSDRLDSPPNFPRFAPRSSRSRICVLSGTAGVQFLSSA